MHRIVVLLAPYTSDPQGRKKNERPSLSLSNSKGCLLFVIP